MSDGDTGIFIVVVAAAAAAVVVVVVVVVITYRGGYRTAHPSGPYPSEGRCNLRQQQHEKERGRE